MRRVLAEPAVKNVHLTLPPAPAAFVVERPNIQPILAQLQQYIYIYAHELMRVGSTTHSIEHRNTPSTGSTRSTEPRNTASRVLYRSLAACHGFVVILGVCTFSSMYDMNEYLLLLGYCCTKYLYLVHDTRLSFAETSVSSICSARSIEPRHTRSTGSIRKTEPRNTASQVLYGTLTYCQSISYTRSTGSTGV